MKTLVKNNIFYFDILDLKFSIQNFELLSMIKDSLFSNIIDYSFIEMKKNKVKKTVIFDKEIFCNIIKSAYGYFKKYYDVAERNNNILLYFENNIYDVKNNKKYKINIELGDGYGKVEEINTKNNKYIKILIKYTDNQSKYKLFQYNKKEKIFNYVCDIFEARNEKEKHLIVSQEGKIFVIDDCIYSMEPMKDYNKISDIFFEEGSIICLLERNSNNKKIIFYNNKTLKEIESKTTKTFNVGNLVFFEHKNNFNVLLNKQELAVKRKCEIIQSKKHFSKIYDDEEFQLYETKSFENDQSNLVMINKIKQEVEFYLKKGEIIKTEDMAFFIEKGYLNIFGNKRSVKKGIKSIQINNSDNLIIKFTYKDDKIYLIEKKLDRFYLMIYDVLNDKIIKETNVNNLCFIPKKFIDDYEYLNNVTEEALQKNFLLNKYGSEQNENTII